jgi:hypothetical protein
VHGNNFWRQRRLVASETAPLQLEQGIHEHTETLFTCAFSIRFQIMQLFNVDKALQQLLHSTLQPCEPSFLSRYHSSLDMDRYNAMHELHMSQVSAGAIGSEGQAFLVHGVRGMSHVPARFFAKRTQSDLIFRMMPSDQPPRRCKVCA